MLSLVIAVALGWLLLSVAAAAGWAAVRARFSPRPAVHRVSAQLVPPQRGVDHRFGSAQQKWH